MSNTANLYLFDRGESLINRRNNTLYYNNGHWKIETYMSPLIRTHTSHVPLRTDYALTHTFVVNFFSQSIHNILSGWNLWCLTTEGYFTLPGNNCLFWAKEISAVCYITMMITWKYHYRNIIFKARREICGSNGFQKKQWQLFLQIQLWVFHIWYPDDKNFSLPEGNVWFFFFLTILDSHIDVAHVQCI